MPTSDPLHKPRTPEFRRSSRVLVQTTARSPPEGQGGSGIFVPRRRSFGIVIKPFDPTRSPARARRARSQSRSQSRSRSRSRSRGSCSSKDLSRSSSWLSLPKLSRRRSRSLGDIDRNDEQFVRESRRRNGNEKTIHVNVEKQPNRSNESGARQLARSQSSSGENIDSSDESEIDEYKKNVIANNYAVHKIRRQQSNEFCQSPGKSPKPTGVTFDFEKNLVNGMSVDKSVNKTEENYYEIVQRKYRDNTTQNHQEKSSSRSGSNVPHTRSTDENEQTVTPTRTPVKVHNNNSKTSAINTENSLQFQGPMNNSQTNLVVQREPYLYDGYRPDPNSQQNTRVNVQVRKAHRVHSDEGTDLDQIPWVDNTEHFHQRNADQFKSKNKPYLNDTKITYSNLEEFKPMLPPKNPPMLPPKTIGLTANSFVESPKRVSNKENFIEVQRRPVLPPKRHSHHQNGIDNGRKMSYEMQLQSTPQPPYKGNSSLDDHWCGQNNANFGERQQKPTQFHNDNNPHINPQQAKNYFMNNNENHSFENYPRKTSDQQQRMNSNLNSQRQFKSTANFSTAGLQPDRDQRMVRAMSTDALTVQGRVHCSPEVQNTDIPSPSKNMKKSKSNLVLDDISISSFNKDGSPKQKLSDDASRGKIEMWSGLLHFLTICSALLVTVPMAVVSMNWDKYAHKCPLYVKNNLQHDRYWGNPSMIPCYVTAYVPLVIITISLTLVFIHGGLLVYWRSKRKSAGFYTTKSFNITLLFFNLVSLLVALTVACVLTDGFRQTCLSFKLISDINFRPTSCQNGFYNLDLNYNIEWTYYYIVLAITGSWITVLLTLILFIMYVIRVGICRCTFNE